MTTSLTIPFLLPPDLLVIPVAELAPASRAKFGSASGDFAITRPRGRTTSSLVDADSAALIEGFRTPRTIVEAVADFSRARAADPHAVLDGVFPVLQRLIAAQLLLPATEDRAKPVIAVVGPGDRVGEFEIVRQVTLLVDVELHQAVSADGARSMIKLARAAGALGIKRTIANEARTLKRLAGLAVPRLVDEGEHDGLPFLATEWCHGVDPINAAAEHRESGRRGRRVLVSMCIDIVRAYEQIHARGVAHGSVHGLNVLVDRLGRVTLGEFGQAYALDEPHGAPHELDAFRNYDPELVAALLQERAIPPATAASEQYAIGALLYQVVTGQKSLELSLQRDTALRQILEEPPLSFEIRGVAPWGEMERLLARMLDKDPAARYPSLAAVLDALDAIAVERAESMPSATAVDSSSTRAADAVFARLALDEPLYRNGLPIGPHCSVNNGAAGIAVAWYRLALLRDDPAAFAVAAAWGKRAHTWTPKAEAFFLHDGTITERNVGTAGLFHSTAGIHCVRGLIAFSGGDAVDGNRSVHAFADLVRGRVDQWDLTLGRAGNLLGAALLYEADPAFEPTVREPGDEVAATLTKRLIAAGSFRHSISDEACGIAHGRAGTLYALLRWASATGTVPPSIVADSLDELALVAQHTGRGASWPRYPDQMDNGLQNTWCNGDCGFVFLWLLAFQILNNTRYADLAAGAGWNIADGSRSGGPDLCCGAAGRAYAFLALYRQTGDDIWLQRAKRFSDRAARAVDPDASTAHRLYKGALGIALLLRELEDPQRARMPLFEPEGWKWRRA